MSLLIKNWQMADWKELLKWAKIGANNAMIGEFAEVEELPPHGRLGDLDALKAKAIERSEKCGEMVNVLDNVITAHDISTAPTIIPAEEAEE